MIEFCNKQWTQAMEGGRLLHKDFPYMWYGYDNVYVRNGVASLYVCREHNEIQDWEGNIYSPTVSASVLRSVDTYGYGTFSAEIMLPRGKNLWPAFWLCGEGDEGWPAVGEIDICEAWTPYFCATIPQPPYLVPSWDVTTNAHWKDILLTGCGGHGYAGSRRLPICFLLKDPSKNFIKYEVEWRQDIITFRVNGKRVRTYGYHVAKHLNDKRMHVIFDLWTTSEDFICETPMKIRNFEYKPIETL